MQIAIAHMQVNRSASFQFAILVDNEGTVGCAGNIFLSACRQGYISLFRGSLAIDDNPPFLGLQIDILSGGDRLHIRPIIADEYFTIPRADVYAAGLRCHGLGNFNIAFSSLDGYIATPRQHIAIIAGCGSADDDAAIISGNIHARTGSNILADQNISRTGFEIDFSLLCIYGIAHSYEAVFRRNIYILGHIHIRCEDDTSLFGDGSRNALFRAEFIRDKDIAVASIEINAGTGINLAILPDDEVAMFYTRFIHILSGFHADVTNYRSGLALNGNRTGIGTDADILIGDKRFFLRHIFTANDNIASACIELNAFVFGFNPLDYGNIALTGF